MPVDLLQVGEPFATPAQAAPHLPQFIRSLVRSTQPPLQSEKPALHATPQLLFPQAAAAFGIVGHAAPHIPQFCGSDAVATQAPPQALWPAGQADLQAPPEQTSVVAQACPQEPQLLAS